MEDFIKKFQIDNLSVFESDHWVVSVRPQQVTVGSLVLSLRRPCSHLGDLQEKETAELAIVFRRLEAMLKEVFAYSKINYLCLMMVDEQVHFHVLPRYAQPVSFRGEEFPDGFWPGPVEINEALDSPRLPQAVHEALIQVAAS